MTLAMTGPGFHSIRIASGGAVTVVSSGVSGTALAGTAGGVIAAIVALATLGITLSTNSRKRRKEAEEEKDERYNEGRKFERDIAARQLETQANRFSDMMSERDKRIDSLIREHGEAIGAMQADRDFYRNLYFNTQRPGAVQPIPPSEQGKSG